MHWQALHSSGLLQYSPKTRMFFPVGNLELDLVETSLSMEDLHQERNIEDVCHKNDVIMQPLDPVMGQNDTGHPTM